MTQLTTQQLISKIDAFVALNTPTEIIDGEVWFKYKLVKVGYNHENKKPEAEYHPNENQCPLVKLNALVGETLYTPDGRPNLTKHAELKTLSNGKYQVLPHMSYPDGSWGTGMLITPKGRTCYG